MLDWGLRLVVLLAVPCALALLVFPLPLVAVLYHYGAFTDFDVQQVTRALMGWGVGPDRHCGHQGAGARLLRQPGHQHPGARWRWWCW